MKKTLYSTLGSVMKKSILWLIVIFTTLTTLGAFGTGAIFAGIALFALTLLLFPINIWQNLLHKFINRKLKTILAITFSFLFIIGLAIANPVPSVSDDTLQKITTSTSVTTNTTITTTTTHKSITTVTTTTTTPTSSTVTTAATTTTVTTTVTKATTSTTTAETTEVITTTIETTVTTTITATTIAPVYDNSRTYILNTNTMKFHHPSCRHVKKIAVENYQEFHGTRDEIINMGYDSCGTCEP